MILLSHIEESEAVIRSPVQVSLELQILESVITCLNSEEENIEKK